MQIETLRRFVALAHAGSFYQASKQMGISVQGYSKLLSSLESELEVPLAIRSRSGISLTPAGEVLLDYAKDAVAGMDKVVADLERLKAPLPESLKRPRMFATHYGMQIISYLDYLSETLSEFELREETFDRLLLKAENPVEEETFCAEIVSEATLEKLFKRGIVFETFYKAVIGVAVRMDSPLAQLPGATKPMVAELDLCYCPDREWNWRIDEIFSSNPLTIRFESTAVSLLMKYVKTAADRGFLTDSFKFYALQSCSQFDTEGLTFVPLADEPAVFRGGMLYSRAHPPSLMAKAVIDRYREFSRSKVPRYLEAYPSLAEEF